ncbi:MAG: hypothetical protein E6640_01900 [Actinomyces urogenitalis]|uniref:hypothetical protein n=1 Tax=Actinomyces urogenitalis TaxID=103621 RepID=UPI00290EF3F9|nr:hypothetical protein [Actinomyces urogenitalis]MDU6150965.1 hypothetical protein [Actinomyces urogenitalis]
MGRRRRTDENFWAQAASVTTTAGAKAGSRGRRAARMRHFIRFTVFTWPLLALTVFALAANLVGGNTNATSGSGDAVPTQVRALALDTVRSWLADESAPLPDANVLGWDHADVVPWPDVKTKDRSERYVTYIGHVLAATDRLTYDVAVNIAYNTTRGATVVGTPSLMVVGSRTPDSGWDPGLWPLAQSAPLTDQVSRAVSTWGGAYAGGDAQALTALVADPNSKHVYQPLSGLTDVSVRASFAATRAVDSGKDPDESTVMVQVVISAARVKDSRAFTMTFDVLVVDATSGSARVVAWGPSGSGPTLTAYRNAVVDVTDAEATVTPSPTASSTSGGPTQVSVPTVPQEGGNG